MSNLNGKLIGEGLTFDDVLLVPAHSNVIPSDVNLKTQLTKNISLNIPLISSAMDTVTESELSIALARQGGVGVIHKNLTITQQSEEVRKVKRSESGYVTEPITITQDQDISVVKDIFDKYRISGLPVIDDNGILIGIITKRDIKYIDFSKALKVQNVMTKEKLITGKKGDTLESAKDILLKNKIEKLPIVDATNKLIGLITTKDIDNKIEFPNACKDEMGRLRVGAAVSTGEDALERVESLVKEHVDFIVLDSAHGDSKGIIELAKKIKTKFPKTDLIAGNIVTVDAAKRLAEAGVDAVKVGVGPGSICTTRVVAGVGVPQITAINDVYQWCDKNNVCVIADGGIKYSGDIVKAIAAGANSVMLGSLFAGTKESPGEEVTVQGRKYKTYVGMGSLSAMKKGSSDRYFQEKTNKKFVPEGIEAMVPYKGELSDVVFQLIGGLRSGMGYVGAADIETLRQKTKFIKISGAGLVESHPHDVNLIKESPNYSVK